MIHVLMLLASTFADDYPFAPAVDTAPPLRIASAWVREAPPNMNVMAGYAVLCNDAETGVILVGASSEEFDSVEMHLTIEANGAVTMEETNSVAIDPRDCVAFAPGGHHFMLIDPVRPFRAGSGVQLTLRLADGREMDVTFPVRHAADALDNSHDHSGHH